MFNAKKTLSALKNSTSFQNAKMMTSSAGKNSTGDLTANKATWLVSNNSCSFQTARNRTMKFIVIKNGLATQIVKLMMVNAGKILTKIKKQTPHSFGCQ